MVTVSSGVVLDWIISINVQMGMFHDLIVVKLNAINFKRGRINGSDLVLNCRPQRMCTLLNVGCIQYER